MKVSYHWLKEYVKKLPSPHELAEILTMAGLEVEGIEAPGQDIQGVVVAQILSIEKHPHADRLTLCKVKTDKDIHSIVCGARNMKVGDKVALALPGALLPKNVKIEKTKIRGVESEGMMCSESELGLKDTSEGIMILPRNLTVGKDFTEAMGLKDFILDINVTPNRPDCLSIVGIAREISAITNGKVEGPKPVPKIGEKGKSIKSLVSVSIDEPSLCRRYAARVIEHITIGPSPDWLRQRLESLGFRSINNVVDVTNYVMIEYGQPLHVFDYERVGSHQIIVRRAREHEKMQTLDGTERILHQDMLVIADSKKPVALAGIMGGKEAEINDTTKNILLESAYFAPSTVRRTSKQLGLSTESSYRFERGIDIEGVLRALDRAAQLITELAGGTIVPKMIDAYPRRYKPLQIKVRLPRITKLLGIHLKKKECESYLKRLGIIVRSDAFDAWKATPPSYRVDLLLEIDIVEEIARIHGYKNIPTTLPAAQLSTTKISGMDLLKERLKEILTDSGFLEAMNYSFISPKLFEITGTDIENGLKISNPLTEEQSIMRQSLIPNLLETLRYNLNRNSQDIKFFEIGRVFKPLGRESEERELVSGLMSGLRYADAWNVGKEGIDFFDIKGVAEKTLAGLGIDAYTFIPKTDIPFLHPGKASVVEINKKILGIVGEVHPDTMQVFDIKQSAYIFELDLNTIITFFRGQKRYVPIPQYPSIVRDIAMLISRDIQFQELYNVIRAFGIKLLEEVSIFDVYCGEHIPAGKHSLALRFTYRSPERTLTDDEVNAAHAVILNNLKERFAIEVRGE